jgi:ABC-type Co2+ transport system permease subunit
MHIPDGFLAPRVLAGCSLFAGAVTAFSSWKLNGRLEGARVPLLGVVSAGIFAAEMLNWPIPGGTSAHFVGGAFATILLGPYPGCLAMASVVVVQAFVFGDGGVTALLVAAALSSDLAMLAGLLGFALVLAVASHVPLGAFLARTLTFAALSGVVVLPQPVLVPGTTLVSVAGVAVTEPGLGYVVLFETRVVASVARVTVLSLTTPFGTVVATLRSLGTLAPVVLA